MEGTQENLPVDRVELDRDNPRIRRFLEDYEGELTDDRIALALDVAADTGEDGMGATSPEKLRNSILANKGIMQPIIVNRLADGRLVCIEGNTRLWIYRDFDATGVEGDWSRIPAIVHDGLEGFEVDAIRLQAHLVGPRAWDAYSKAKYQWELHYKHLMPLDRLVDLCGGDRRDVQRSINAYADMENHFRKLHEPEEPYLTQRFSGFVELQSNKVKTAILKAGFSLDDFATWIKDERIKGLAGVRQLPRVLSDRKARDAFVKKGLKAALDVLEKPEVNSTLREASIGQLARILTEKLEGLPWPEIQRLRADPDDDMLRYLIDAQESLTTFLAELDK
ncbi:ParB N-terminal domain-containing protein [Blastomonas fulva]|uniref:ParB N-terminal domain-containing protein n=1 Tax=Blastomonas fulva TaxID=1550728 RepID=UPI003F6FF502